MGSRDKIVIKNARFSCSVGVLEREKMNMQDIYLDIELFTDLRTAGLTDNIDSAQDYSEIHDDVKRITAGRHFNLIESIAEETASMIIEKYNADSVLVKVKKPEALKDRDVEYTAVEITREK